MARNRRPAFIVAGAASGSGKTILTLALMEALRRRGLAVQPFKSGPDYIDPGHHRALTGRPSYNLDTWMMGPDCVKRTFLNASSKADVSVVEGVMGLYDGKDGTGEEGSTAHLAKTLGLPVLLVVNAEKAARSVAAVVKGFEEFDRGVDIRWVAFNKAGSPGHFKVLKAAVEASSRAKVLGYLPRDEALVMPERHLGLVTSREMDRAGWRRLVRKAASLAEGHLDIDALVKGPGIKGACPRAATALKASPRPDVTIAVAVDNAFCFYYEENLEALKALGARLVYFSPMKDSRLPKNASGVYIGGGYPELNAGALEANVSMREDIRSAARRNMPVFAECGGLMYLGRSLEGPDGKAYRMAGVFPWATRMSPKRRALGYREITAGADCPMLPKGGRIRGHEFHYSSVSGASRVKKAFSVRAVSSGATAQEGYLKGATLATYVHLHFASNMAFARNFVELARGFSDK